MSRPSPLVTYHRPVLEEVEVARLVESATTGDRQAWDQLVEAFSGLVWSVIRGHGIYGAEAADIFQTVWLRFVEHVGRLNHPGRPGAWLATTARHECYRVTRRSARVVPSAEVPEVPSVDGADVLLDDLERTGRRDAVLAAVEQLPARCQELLRVLGSDPPLSYDEVAEIMEMPKGSIGPTRGRCLDRLRRILADAADGGSLGGPRR
jgi:RNA polymerase sigma factor (sigma-70 family)